MPYTPPSPADVRAILSNKAAIKDDVGKFIEDAEAIVSQIEGLDDETRQKVSKYLTAHLISLPYPILRETTSVGGNSTTNYSRGHHGLALDYTPYGQTAKLLDVTGTLAKLEAKSKEDAKQKTARIRFFG